MAIVFSTAQPNWRTDPRGPWADPAHLVARLAPTSPKIAERALRRIFKRLAGELFREQTEAQDTEQVGKELGRLKKALEHLSPRAHSALLHAFADDAARQDLIAIRYPTDHPTFPTRPLSGWVVTMVMCKAVDRALSDIPKKRRGPHGTVSDATRRAIYRLCRLYCRATGKPMPTPVFRSGGVRNPEALTFALDCLRTWCVPIPERLEPRELVRSMHAVSRSKAPY